MKPRSRWSRHVEKSTGKVYCHHKEEARSIWGDPEAEGAWEDIPGGGYVNKVTNELHNAEGTEAQWMGVWYPCKVRRVKPDGTVDVTWEDGTGTNDVQPKDVRNLALKEQAEQGRLWNVHTCWNALRQFYVHSETGNSTWHDPPDRQVWARAKLSWKQYDEYFYNFTTGEISVTLPTGWYYLLSVSAEAYWHGSWYPCTIWRKRLDGLYDVRWEDGTGTRRLSSSEVRTPVPPLPSTGPDTTAEEHFESIGITRTPCKPHIRAAIMPLLELTMRVDCSPLKKELVFGEATTTRRAAGSTMSDDGYSQTVARPEYLHHTMQLKELVVDRKESGRGEVEVDVPKKMCRMLWKGRDVKAAGGDLRYVEKVGTKWVKVAVRSLTVEMRCSSVDEREMLYQLLNVIRPSCNMWAPNLCPVTADLNQERFYKVNVEECCPLVVSSNGEYTAKISCSVIDATVRDPLPVPSICQELAGKDQEIVLHCVCLKGHYGGDPNWQQAVEEALPGYAVVASEHIDRLCLVLLTTREWFEFVTCLEHTANEDGAAMSLKLFETSLVFAAASLRDEQRACKRMISSLKLGNTELDLVNQFDHTFWLGDYDEPTKDGTFEPPPLYATDGSAIWFKSAGSPATGLFYACEEAAPIVAQYEIKTALPLLSVFTPTPSELCIDHVELICPGVPSLEEVELVFYTSGTCCKPAVSVTKSLSRGKDTHTWREKELPVLRLAAGYPVESLKRQVLYVALRDPSRPVDSNLVGVAALDLHEMRMGTVELEGDYCRHDRVWGLIRAKVRGRAQKEKKKQPMQPVEINTMVERRGRRKWDEAVPWTCHVSKDADGKLGMILANDLKVLNVQKGGPAERAGVKAGMVVCGVAATVVRDPPEYFTALSRVSNPVNLTFISPPPPTMPPRHNGRSTTPSQRPPLASPAQQSQSPSLWRLHGTPETAINTMSF